MAVGFERSRGVTLLPMTEAAREFVLSGIRSQSENAVPRFTEDDVGRVVTTTFAQSEIQVTVEGELNGRDVIIFFSYEQPVNEQIAVLRLVMQITKREPDDD